MRTRVGFDRELRLEWLNEVVEQVFSGMSEKELRAHLNDYLSMHGIKNDANRKTILVLRGIWLNVPEELLQIRDEGINLFHLVNERDRIWLHWGMCLLAYPFFKDIAEIIGLLQSLQDDITMKQIKRRFTEHWGSRTTTNRAIGRVVQSMNWWDVLDKTEKNGVYRYPLKMTTECNDLQKWLVHVLVQANTARMIPLQQLFNLSISFPFKITIDSHELKKSERLHFHRDGSGLEMVSYAVAGHD